MDTEIGSSVEWQWWVDPLCGEYVAACDSLSLTASGETFGELVEDIARMRTALFQYLAEEGRPCPDLPYTLRAVPAPTLVAA